MAEAVLHDAFAHHLWATDRLLGVLATLTPEQLAEPVPGTYGPILDTTRHLVGADAWYLSFFRSDTYVELDDDDKTIGLDQIRSTFEHNSAIWPEVIGAASLDLGEDIVERGNAWEFHAPTSLRLAQVVHHGTDHRSQICTALTHLGIEPPAIDVWDWGEATGRTRVVDLRPAGSSG
jgi:uncharacterized damage-inducible protein DinB